MVCCRPTISDITSVAFNGVFVELVLVISNVPLEKCAKKHGLAGCNTRPELSIVIAVVPVLSCRVFTFNIDVILFSYPIKYPLKYEWSDDRLAPVASACTYTSK